MSSFSWLAYSEAERERTRDLISQFSERGTQDELGIGRIRDAFADLLFPGTTTIQTRAKYFLFVPWIYRKLEDRQVTPDAVDDTLRNREVQLIDALLKGDDLDGVIGRYAKSDLQRVPSNIYWAGLGTWEIRRFNGSQAEYHDSLNVYYDRLDHAGDDVMEAPRPNWDPGIPEPPADFLDATDFHLREQDATYLRDRILESNHDSMLANILQAEKPPGDADAPWHYPHRDQLTDDVQTWLRHGRNFSDIIHGATLLYTYMLAEEAGDDELTSEYAADLEEWQTLVESRRAAFAEWDRDEFWSIVRQASANTPHRMQQFVNQWIDIAVDADGAILHHEAARRLVENREHQLKGGRARLQHKSALEQWGGEAGAQQLTYRWRVAKTHLQDIFAGLEAT